MVFGLISSVTNHIIGKTTVKSITSYGVDSGTGLLYSNLVGMTPIPSGASTFINLDSGYSARTDTSSSYTVSNSTAGYTYANGTYNTLTSGAFAGGYYSYFPFNNYTNNGDPSWSSSNNWSGGTNTNFSTSVTSVGTVYGPWIQIQLPYTSYLFSYAIRTRGTNGVPKAWYIVGSNDGTTWTVIDNQTNAISTTNTTTYNSFNTPTTAYSYYRMIIYQNYGTSYSSLIRFDLNGYLTGVPSDIKLINLVNWYKFDSADVTGSTVKDFITNTYNATLAGSATVSTTQSKFGGASLYVNGVSSSYCAIPAFTFNGTTGMSIAFWTYVTAYSAGHPPFKMAINSSATIASNYGQIIRPWYGTGPANQNPITNFYVDTDNIDTPISGSSVTILNQWNHLVYVLSGTVLKMYVNGSLYGSATLHAALQNITYNTFLIGSDVNYNGAQTAYFDDFRVYNAQITAEQVVAIYILGGYRYFKFEVVNVNDNGSSGYAGIQEIIIGYNNVKLSYTGATATDINNNGYSAEGPANAIDGTNSKWTTGFTSTNNPHPTLIVDFKTSQIVNSYTFVTGYDTSGRDPCSWILYGSYNNTNWTTLDTRTIIPNQYGRSTQLPWYTIVDPTAAVTPSISSATAVAANSSITFGTFSYQHSNMCCSSNGSYIYVMTNDSASTFKLYSSPNGGSTFSLASSTALSILWYSQIVCDSTGQYVWFTGGNSNDARYSNNYGVSFTTLTGAGYAGGICMSSDGTKVMISGQNVVRYSSNGTSATPTFTAGTQTGAQASGNVASMVCSSSGKYVYYINSSGTTSIIYSSDFGQSYTSLTTPVATLSSTSFVGCDSTGQYVAFINSTGNACYLSNNYGGSWVLLNTTVIPSAALKNLRLVITASKNIYIIMSGNGGSPFTNNLYGGCSTTAGCMTPANWTWTSLKNDQTYNGIAVSSTKIYAMGSSTVVTATIA